MFEMQKMMEQMMSQMQQMMGPQGMGGMMQGMMTGMQTQEGEPLPVAMMKQCMGMFQQGEQKEEGKA